MRLTFDNNQKQAPQFFFKGRIIEKNNFYLNRVIMHITVAHRINMLVCSVKKEKHQLVNGPCRCLVVFLTISSLIYSLLRLQRGSTKLKA